jgi:hypothetical protein
LFFLALALMNVGMVVVKRVVVVVVVVLVLVGVVVLVEEDEEDEEEEGEEEAPVVLVLVGVVVLVEEDEEDEEEEGEEEAPVFGFFGVHSGLCQTSGCSGSASFSKRNSTLPGRLWSKAVMECNASSSGVEEDMPSSV